MTTRATAFACELLTTSLIALLLGAVTTAQEGKPARPYVDADAYQVYSLLLPDEESYHFAKDALIIQENTAPTDISGACLKPEDAKRFKGAIEGYNRVNKTRWLLQRKFQIAKPYRIVGAKIISALPDHPQGAVSYVRMSPVGFNGEKTQAIVFLESSCGGLCGRLEFHFLKKVHGKWSQVSVKACIAMS